VTTWVDAVLARPDADAVLDEARMWLEECVWADMDADTLSDAVDALTPVAVLAMVDAHYGGGLAVFVRATVESVL
jgi:hypothetical protein